MPSRASAGARARRAVNARRRVAAAPNTTMRGARCSHASDSTGSPTLENTGCTCSGIAPPVVSRSQAAWCAVFVHRLSASRARRRAARVCHGASQNALRQGMPVANSSWKTTTSRRSSPRSCLSRANTSPIQPHRPRAA